MTPDQESLAGCEAFDSLLDEFVEESLDAAESERVSAHVATCETCATACEALHRATRALATLPELDCPDHVIDRAAAIGRPATPTRQRTAHLRPAWRYAALLAIAASLVLMLVPTSETQRSPQQAATDSASEPESSTPRAQLAQARDTLREVRSAVADNRIDVSARAVERGLVQPLQKTFAAVSRSKLGEWGATAGALLNAVQPAPRENNG
ncbi:MAG: zf-HC2 domain-containing protein [Planctomycetota bacterium]